MPASVKWKRKTGPTNNQTDTDITSGTTLFSTSDNPNPGTDTPLIIPGSGSTNYSYWVTTYLDVETTPAGTIDSFKFYADGANTYGTGITETVATSDTYVQATGTAQSGDILNQTNHTGISGAPVDTFTYTSASPLALTGSISNPSTGKLGPYLVQQMAVESTAASGATPTETKTGKFNET